MNLKWIGLSLLALSLALVAPSKAKAAVGGSPAAFAQEHGDWETPPAEFREVQRQGYHDGVEGARKDFENHRRPDVENRDEYRHPHVSSSMRDDYREGYRRGYQAGVDHLYGHDHY
jgi:ribosome modulation factor